VTGSWSSTSVTLNQERGTSKQYATQMRWSTRIIFFGCGASNALAVWEVRCQEVKASESSQPIKRVRQPSPHHPRIDRQGLVL